MTNERFSNGRLTLLPKDYATFRKKIFDFIIKEVLPNTKCIFDPMAGTAPLIPYIEKMGIKAHFNDLLPLHYFINKSKTLRCYETLKKIEKRKHNFLNQEIIHCLRSLFKKKLLISTNWIHHDILDVFIKGWEKTQNYEEDISILLKAIILLCVRPYSCYTPSISNPTWLKKGGMSTGKSLNFVVKEIVNKFKAFFDHHYSNASVKKVGECRFSCENAESINLNMKFDKILTSPPYANRFDPISFYGPELYFLSAVNYHVNKNEILGTTKIRDYQIAEEDLIYIKKVAPKTMSFLEAIIEKSEPRESEYYPKTFVRYYSSLFRTLNNNLKFLKKNGKFYIVVQNNIHRGELNEMNSFLMDFFNRAGYETSIEYQKVQPHMGKRNISEKYPLVIKKHLECVIRVQR